MIFVNGDNADLMPGLLRVKARIQSQQSHSKLEGMLKELRDGGPNPIYNELLSTQSTSFRLRRFLLDSETEAQDFNASL